MLLKHGKFADYVERLVSRSAEEIGHSRKDMVNQATDRYNSQKWGDWVMKIIIGGVLSIIPIINFIATGYMVKVMKNSINKTPGMPEWKGFGDYYVKGLILFVIALVYMIVPLIIFGAIAGFSSLSYYMGDLTNPYANVGHKTKYF